MPSVSSPGFLKGGTAYPLVVREGLAVRCGPSKKMIFPDLSLKLVRQEALFMDIPAGKFWCYCRAQFSNLAKKAFEVFVPFVTTIIDVSNRFP